MVTDRETNFVFFSSLVRELPGLRRFWSSLEKTLASAGIHYSFIKNTKDLWCRDYMPVQVAKNEFVQFRFNPSYLADERWQHLLTDTEKTEPEAPFSFRPQLSLIVLDGGNLVRSRNTVLLTDRAIRENAGPRDELVQHLRQLLKVDKVFLLPSQPYDISGHADGMVRLLDNHTVLVAGYQAESSSWQKKYENALRRTGLEVVEFPSVRTAVKNEDGDYAALGCYINFAWIGGVILFPQFDLPEDIPALHEAKKILSVYKVLPVPAAELAMYGGVLNCATWSILV
jgi:agmatine deiminase